MIEPKSPLPWTLEPRHVGNADRIRAGEDPIKVAATSDEGDFLGWYLIGPEEPGRGHYVAKDAAYIAVACNFFQRMLAELERVALNQDEPDIRKLLRELRQYAAVGPLIKEK